MHWERSRAVSEPSRVLNCSDSAQSKFNRLELATNWDIWARALLVQFLPSSISARLAHLDATAMLLSRQQQRHGKVAGFFIYIGYNACAFEWLSDVRLKVKRNKHTKWRHCTIRVHWVPHWLKDVEEASLLPLNHAVNPIPKTTKSSMRNYLLHHVYVYTCM